MGNEPSKRIKETPLMPQPRFPRVINKRFMQERAMSLALQEGFWSHKEPQALEIIDIDTNKVMFKILPQPTDMGTTIIKKKQLLLDHNSVPIVTMEGYTVGPEYGMYIPAVPLPASAPQDNSLNRVLCFLETNTRPLERCLRLELPDPSTVGGVANITVEGTWRSHRAVFYLDRGVRVDRECIARVHAAPIDKKNQKNQDPKLYQVDIAPGVDVALIVLACAALDEELAKKNSGKGLEVGTDEMTKMLADRHYGMEPRDRRGAKSGKALFIGTDL